MDIFQAVKTVRRHRPQLVENIVRALIFGFLHFILLDFNCFFFLLKQNFIIYFLEAFRKYFSLNFIRREDMMIQLLRY